MVRKSYIWMIAVIVCVLLNACVREEYTSNDSTVGVEEYNEGTVGIEEELLEDEGNTEEVENPIVLTQGQYTVGDILEMAGFFIAYDDGSFDRYKSGGFCIGLTDPYHSKGMYLLDSISESLPVINADKNLVLVWNGEYSVKLYLVNAETTALQYYAENGKLANARYWPGGLDVVYSDYSEDRIYIEYINGMRLEEYEDIEEFEFEYYPYAGSTSSIEATKYWAFPKGETILIGTADGTTLRETEYEINATYYDFEEGHNDYDVTDVFYPKTIPTKDGYAKMDMSEIPAGRYVMVVKGDDSYIATLIDLQDT